VAFNSQAIATFTATLPEPTSDYAVTIDWGDGTTSAGQVVSDASGSYAVSGKGKQG